MAEEGEQVSGRREVLSRNCLTCLNKGTEKLAEKYCLVCERFFCPECTELHDVVLGDHALTEIESGDMNAHLATQMEICPKHGKVLNLYCTEEEMACCEICIAKEHTDCKEAVYLPKVATEFLKDVDMDEMNAKIRETIERLESIKLIQATTMSSLEADGGQSLKKIDDHHAELLLLMDKIVASSKDKVETTFQRLSKDLERHRHEVEKCLVDLEANEISIESNQGNDIQLFLELKKYQKQSKANDEVSMVSMDNLKVRGFNVAMDYRLHDLLLELEVLVSLLNRAPAQVKETFKINIGSENDTSRCKVYGACALSDDSVLVCDYGNKQLKRLHTESRSIIDQCAMLAGPVDVCCTNRNEVAVTNWSSTVVFVSVKPRLVPIRTIEMSHVCAYCAYSQAELFISDQKKTAYVYTMEGSLLRKITTDPSGEEIFSKTRHIAINDEGNTVYIVDAGKGLVTMDRQGNVLDKLVSDKISWTWGVCTDGTGGLFVCGFTSNNVIHVGADGQILAEVLTSSDGLVKPTSVCFDRVRKRLIVSQLERDQLYVCELY